MLFLFRKDWEANGTIVLEFRNSASHLSIKEYLKSVREEQAQARVQPHKAVPLFEDKIE